MIEFPSIRAILLGKLGNHDGALQIYVHKLDSCEEAEESVQSEVSFSTRLNVSV